MKNSRVQLMAKIAVMGALASIVMMLEFPLPLVPPFYKIDFSEVIVLLSGFALGPLAAIGVEAIKILLHLLISGSSTAGVGELANFIIGCALVLPATIVYQKHKSRHNALIGMTIGTICLCIAGALMNYIVLLPAYAYAFHMPLSALIDIAQAVNPNINNLFTFICIGVIPFNLIKGILTSLIVFFVYKHVSPIIKKNY